MKWAVTCVILLAILGYAAGAIVYAFTEAKGKPLPNKYRYPAVIITTAILFSLMALWAKSCPSTNEELTAPNGQTTTEHYEPRY
jgi:hypothetical protein